MSNFPFAAVNALLLSHVEVWLIACTDNHITGLMREHDPKYVIFSKLILPKYITYLPKKFMMASETPLLG